MNSLIYSMQRTLLLGFLGLVLAGVAVNVRLLETSANNPSLSSFVPSTGVRVAQPAPADTLRRRVTAGDDLIVTLPRTLSNRSVRGYQIVRAPALSWLVDRSFLWRTRPEDAGTHALLVQAAFQDVAPDTLTILVEVTE